MIYNKNVESWTVESLDGGEEFRFSLPAKLLKEGDNDFLIRTVNDFEGEEIISEESFNIVLNDLAFFEKLESWFNQLSLFLERIIK